MFLMFNTGFKMFVSNSAPRIFSIVRLTDVLSHTKFVGITLVSMSLSNTLLTISAFLAQENESLMRK